MRYLSTLSLAIIVHVLLSIVVLMALAACSSTDIEATVEARLAQERGIEATVKADVQQKVVATVRAVLDSPSPEFSLPTPNVDNLVRVGEIIEKQKEVYWKSPNKYLSTIEIKYREWSEEAVAIYGPYNSGYYTFQAPAGKKFIVLIFDVTNTSSREVEKPLIAASEILTNPWGDYFDGWKPSGGIDAEGYDARKSTPEEIERFGSWYSGLRDGIKQRQTVQMTALFEIPENALPVQAEISGFDRPFAFD